jgi:hypothetical protein
MKTKVKLRRVLGKRAKTNIVVIREAFQKVRARNQYQEKDLKIRHQ